MIENLFSSTVFFNEINDFNKKELVDFAYSEKFKNVLVRIAAAICSN